MDNQPTLWGNENAEDFRRSLELQNFGLIRHGLSLDEIDEAAAAYANFTDNLPDPPLELVEAMIPRGDDPKVVGDLLDNLDYDQDDPDKYEWHKYRTNYPEFAKPGGYTNRSLQTEALYKVRGITVIDDPKEFYHFHPTSTVSMNEIHRERGWGSLPPEVDQLHAKLMRIHNAGADATRFAYQALEDTHPEILPKHFGPKDVHSSPLRVLLYHRDLSEPLLSTKKDDQPLAGAHTDKAAFTIQVAESHLGLWLNDESQFIDREPEFAVGFAGKTLNRPSAYPESTVNPGWHGVKNKPEASRGRQLHGQNAARTAIIFFANSLLAGTVLDKAETHTRPDELVDNLLPDEAVA
ncbi:MAG TPA: hypothetical protein VLF39_04065 [Candidatus Saccharimonadales bacterium]|nr:hypothetical protein [Candidatus Saccharimonadales bacterium]